jgi:hypothetical protein
MRVWILGRALLLFALSFCFLRLRTVARYHQIRRLSTLKALSLSPQVSSQPHIQTTTERYSLLRQAYSSFPFVHLARSRLTRQARQSESTPLFRLLRNLLNKLISSITLQHPQRKQPRQRQPHSFPHPNAHTGIVMAGQLIVPVPKHWCRKSLYVSHVVRIHRGIVRPIPVV